MIGVSQPPIAIGRTAEVYAWQHGQVLKLFFEWVPLQDIEYEARLGRAIHASGLPVPAVGQIIRLNQRYGLEYARVEGQSMWQAIAQKPWRVTHFARRLAVIQNGIHTQVLTADLPNQRQRLTHKILAATTLPDDLRHKALAQLKSLPDGDRLCHGDFHPGNILITAQEAVVIDWIDVSLGNPLADLARTSILALGAAEKQVRGVFPKTLLRLFHALYLRAYFERNPLGEAEYTRWLPVVAAARLSENIPELESWLVAQTAAGLSAE